MKLEAQLATDNTGVALADELQDNDWWAEQKLDGQRYMVRWADDELTAYNRNGVELNVPDHLRSDFTEDMFGKYEWIFDGELLEDGSYWIFDILYCGTQSVTDWPLLRRRNVLDKIFAEWPATHCHLVRVAKTKEEKFELLWDLISSRAEGVILKNRTAKYVMGKRVKSVMKSKFVRELDAIVMELDRDDKPLAVTIGLYFGDEVLEVSGLKVGGIDRNSDAFPKVGDVVEVGYLYATDDNKLTQPTFKRVRTDKAPEECTSDQLQHTCKDVV